MNRERRARRAVLLDPRLGRRVINGSLVIAQGHHLPGTWTHSRGGNWVAYCSWCGRRLLDKWNNEYSACPKSPMARAMQDTQTTRS